MDERPSPWQGSIIESMPSAADSLSDGQRRVLAAITAWYRAGGYPPLTLGGLAGTGKTTLAALLPDVLPDACIAFTAFTGKAVSVLRRRLPASVAADQVSTLHRLLYRAHEVTSCTESGDLVKGNVTQCRSHIGRPFQCALRSQVSFTPAPDPLNGFHLVVADEASMIPEQLWRDLTCYGVPVLAIGDHGQLPPVRSSFNLMANPALRLEVIHRQAAADPSGAAILNVARWAREHGHVPHGWYGPDVMKLPAADHQAGRGGLHPAAADLVICATNRERARHNQLTRAWHGRHGAPQPGDAVICLRNNYAEGLYNGQRGTILDAHPSPDVGDEEAFSAVIQLEDLEAPWAGAVALRPFGNPAFQPPSVRERSIALFDFGYAVTCHKAQGSQAASVLVIEEGWPAPGTQERSRWLYTAVTRAEKALTIAG